MIGMFTLVQALLLTISPSLMLNLSGGTWDSLQQNIAQCNVPNTDSLWYNQIFIPLWNFIIASITTECLGLVLAVQYFLFRPKGKEAFIKWWNMGFYGMILLTSCILTTVFCTLISLVYFVCYLIIPESELCATVQATQTTGRMTALSGKHSYYCYYYCYDHYLQLLLYF